MQPSERSQSIDETFDRVGSAFTTLGLSPDVVAAWSLPRIDARRLIDEMTAAEPRNILEVGTFVGFSTLLMALHAPTGAVIHTVDPNLRLHVELDAMNTALGRSDASWRPHDIASRAASALHVESALRFHAGGFSTGATFSSSKHDPSDVVPVVGPEICERHGPFDFVFIDGLHYTEAVLSDVRLASRHLAPGGRIVLHDVIGMWGSSVRRALHAFLLECPQFRLRHGRYATLYDAIGVLERRPAAPRRTPAMHDGSRGLLARSEFVTNLASIIVDVCRPRSVAYLGGDRGGLLGRLRDFGVLETLEIGPGVGTDGTRFDFDRVYEPRARVDLCIVLGDGDDLDAAGRENLVASCVALSDSVLWGCSAPGEQEAVGAEAQPIAWWAERFLRHRYVFHDVVRMRLEPLRFAFSFTPTYPVDSSELGNVLLARRLPPVATDEERAGIERVLIEKESRIEDLSLQGISSDLALQDTLRRWRDAQGLYDEAAAALGQHVAEQRRTTGLLETLRAELRALARAADALLDASHRTYRWMRARDVSAAVDVLRSRLGELQQQLGDAPLTGSTAQRTSLSRRLLDRVRATVR